MKVMVIIKANKKSEAGQMPSEKVLTAMGNYNEELVNAGVMLSAEGLHPSSKGKRINVAGGKATVIDGPFAETKELVAGFWIWKVKSMDEAVQWARRIPNPDNEDYQVELRQVGEIEDFGDEFTPEAREQEAKLRERLEKKKYSSAP